MIGEAWDSCAPGYATAIEANPVGSSAQNLTDLFPTHDLSTQEIYSKSVYSFRS